MLTRKLLPAVIGLIVPVAAMSITPVLAKSPVKSHKVTHHVHHISHKKAAATKAS